MNIGTVFALNYPKLKSRTIWKVLNITYKKGNYPENELTYEVIRCNKNGKEFKRKTDMYDRYLQPALKTGSVEILKS